MLTNCKNAFFPAFVVSFIPVYLFAVTTWSQVVNGVFGQQVSGWLWSSFHETCPIHTNLWSIFVVSLYILISQALFDFIFYQALTNLVPRVLSFSSHSGSRVVEGPGNEVELWPLLSLHCFMMSESSVGCNCIWGSYLQSKITFSHPNPF